MSQKSNPALIGAFIIGALALGVAGVLLFGSGKWFRDTAACVMYFDGDVQGLGVGSAVKFRGVKIGEVTSVATRLDRETLQVRIPVYVDLIEPRQQLYGRAAEGESGDPMQALVDRGLRAQLQAESLVTGQLFVQLDFYPDAPAAKTPLVDPLSGRYEIPTVPTILQKAQTTLEQLFRKVSKLPLEDMLASLQGALEGADRLLNSPELARAPAELSTTLAAYRRLAEASERALPALLAAAERTLDEVGRASAAVPEVATRANAAFTALEGLAAEDGARMVEGIGSAAREARRALAQTRVTMERLEALTLPTSPGGHQLQQTLRELAAAARAIRTLADALEATPNAVIFGREEEAPQ